MSVTSLMTPFTAADYQAFIDQKGSPTHVGAYSLEAEPVSITGGFFAPVPDGSSNKNYKLEQ
jgi:hypothetical protein